MRHTAACSLLSMPILALALALAVGAAPAQAAKGAKGAKGASRDEAQAMVRKGVAYIKTHGAQRAYAEISKKKGAFVDRDLYLVVYGMDGKCLAHGANEKMVGLGLVVSEN